MRLDLRRTGDALRASAPDLARIWRAARLQAGSALFPGLIDGLVEDFVARAGEALWAGEPPEAVWAGTVGVARVAPGTAAELDAEWRVLAEVLASACQTLEAEPAAADHVALAVEEARRGPSALDAGRRPPGVLVVRQRSGFRTRVIPYSA